jgi:hypothetical protein
MAVDAHEAAGVEAARQREDAAARRDAALDEKHAGVATRLDALWNEVGRCKLTAG